MTDELLNHSTTLEMDPEYEYTIAARKKTTQRRAHPLFRAVGYKTMHKNQSQGFPFLETLLELSKPEQELCRLILLRLDVEDNSAYVPPSLLDSWDSPKLSKVYKKLKNRGLVKRIMPHRYMVNPDAIFHPRTYGITKEKWDSLD